MFIETLAKRINQLAEENNTNRISLFTEHLKIEGNVYLCEGKCRDIKDHVLTLTDAIVCNIDDYCSCDDDDCQCNDYVCFKYDWLTLNADKILGYSIIK